MTRQSVRQRDNSSTESCGYITFFLSNIFIIVYFLWALLPSHIIEHINEHYTTYYPPRELAGYIPAYLALLFFFVPVLYMGLNMMTCSPLDSIDGIWDTRSNKCANSSIHRPFEECTNECNNNSVDQLRIGSLPPICDEDIRQVNLRIRKQLSKQAFDG
mmetsp:Transcript_14353/g.30569  ORF Transcript_14353/g.30569 Transcript_14353/m.30569 type:complete len:159 (+) Transcript_14353:103-579(+)